MDNKQKRNRHRNRSLRTRGRLSEKLISLNINCKARQANDFFFIC